MPTGKLYKRDDKWYVYVSTGRKVDGKYVRIRHKCQGRTKAEAQAELDEMLYEMRRGGRNGKALNNVYPLASVCDMWCEYIERTYGNPELISGYAIQARRMAKAAGVETVDELTVDIAERALRKIAEKYSTNTANKALAKLKAALEHARERGAIASNPIVKVKQLRLVRKKFRRELEREEVEALLSTAPEPWRTFWHFMLSTGVRRNEFLFLLWANVDLKRKQARIVSRDDFKPKTEAGVRTIPLNENIAAALSKLPKNAESLCVVSGKPVRPEMLLDMFRKHIAHALRQIARKHKKAGSPLPRNVSYSVEDDEFKVDIAPLDLHSMRYTFITELIAARVDPKTVQYLAGHASVETTLAIYAKVKGGNTEEAVNVLSW